MQAAVEQAAAADGGLRIAVCCAGTGWAQKVAGSKGPHPLLPFETIIAINLIGTFNVLRFAAAAMIANEPLRGRRTRRVRQHRLDRRLRRPGRPDRLLGLQGRRRRHDAAGRARPRAVRDPRQHDRPGPVRHAAARGAARGGPRRSSAPASPSRSASAQPAEYAQLACQIVENRMLNGETIRLDGALRMPPR